jgi:hypothetical protein
MAYSKTSEQVTFAYTQEQLFDKVSLMSTFMTKDIKTKEGVSLAEELSLSEDERVIFTEHLGQSVSNIHELLQRHLGAELVGVTLESSLIITIKNNPNYTDSNLSLLDTSLENTIAESCLMEWFKTCSQVELFKLAAEKYVAFLDSLRDRLFLLKKKRAI